MHRFRTLAVIGAAAILATVGLAACSDDDDDASDTTTTTASGSASGTTATGAKAVTISGFAFSPASIQVKVGDTISVTNQDSVSHTLTADDGSFDTGAIAKGQTKTVTVSKAGTFPYHCTPHPQMKGTIQVS